MRQWGVFVAILLIAACSAWARREETLEELKTRAQSANAEERNTASVRVAELQLDAADKLFTEGKPDQAQTTLAEVVTYSEKARDAATQSNKRLKSTEIAVRKMTHKLRDVKRTVAFEDQAGVQSVIDRLERVRTDLLAKMFGKGEK